MSVLYVFALEAEAGDQFNDLQCLFTGVGKVQAAHQLTKEIQNSTPSKIVNVGSVGSSNFEMGKVVNPTSFYQRDMDATALGFEEFHTPFSEGAVPLVYGERLSEVPEAICGSGDNFVNATTHDKPYNIIDMESYALAYVAQQYNIPFLCLKYVTDGSDSTAASDWQNQVHKTAKKLRSFCV